MPTILTNATCAQGPGKSEEGAETMPRSSQPSDLPLQLCFASTILKGTQNAGQAHALRIDGRREQYVPWP